jgi:O-antigen/teichoic acid export membrane protein
VARGPATVTEPPGPGGSLAARAFWLLVAKTVAFLFSFALPLLLVRRLDQFEFGLYKQTFLVIGTAVTMLPTTLSMSAYYFLPRERERQGQVVFNILLFNAALGGVACLALAWRPALLTVILGETPLVAYGPLIGVVILLLVVASFLEIVAVAHQDTRLATVFIVGSHLSRSAMLLLAASVVGTIESLIYAALVHGAIQTVVLLVYLRHRFGRFWRPFEWSMLRGQLAYALPLGLAGLVYNVQTELHNYFVSHQFGATWLAVYAIGCFQLPLVGILYESVASVMIPRVSYLQKEGRRRDIFVLTVQVMRKLAMVYCALYGFLIVMGREFMVFLFTDKYLASWPIFAINLTLIPLAILITDPIMRAYAEHRFFLIMVNVVGLVVFIGIWVVAREHLDLRGVITLVVGVKLLEQLMTAVKAAHILGVRWSDLPLLKDIGKLAVAALVAGGLTASVRVVMLPGTGLLAALMVGGVVFTVAYVATGLALGTLTTDERRRIRRRLERLFRRWPWRRSADHPIRG